MWTSRREIVYCSVFLLESIAVISINDLWKLVWAKSYLGAIGGEILCEPRRLWRHGYRAPGVNRNMTSNLDI